MKKLNRWTLLGVGLGMASSFVAPNVRADDAQDMAGNLFDAGAVAYDAGQYLIAAEAFLKAYDILKSPALHFSAAQAYRRQYFLDSSPDALRRAVRLYREYIKGDPSGERREDAVSALADLVPLEARLRRKNVAAIATIPSTPPTATDTGKPITGKPAPVPINVPGSTAPTPTPPTDVPPDDFEDGEEPPEPPRQTRVLISIKPTMAEVSIDDGAFVHVPAVVEVKAGPHKVHAKAEGYFDDDFEVDAVEKELVARHVVLRPKPGRLSVTGVSGASLSLDGQVRAVLPLEHPIDLEPGEHFLSVTRAGRASFSKTITIVRDKDVVVKADTAMTPQRVAAWSTLTVGLLGAAATGVLGGLTLHYSSTASSLDAQRRAGTMTPNQIGTFNDALALRNRYATPAAIVGSASALVLLTSAGMFLFDTPAIIPLPQKKNDSGPPGAQMKMTVGLMSAGMRIDF